MGRRQLPNLYRDRSQRSQGQPTEGAAEKWAAEHGLTLCPDKTFVVVFARKPSPISRPITINGQNIQVVNKAKYLGVWLDSGLTFQHHIQHKIDSCKHLLHRVHSALTRYVRAPPPHLLKWAYDFIVLPTFNYGCHFCAHKATPRNNTKMHTLQRLALTMITHAFPDTPKAGLEVIMDLPPLWLRIRKDAALKYLRTRNHYTRTWQGIANSRALTKKGHIKANVEWLHRNKLDYPKVEYGKMRAPPQLF